MRTRGVSISATRHDMSKPAKTYNEQIAVLVDRGLVVRDIAFVEHCLAHHNYYRLSPYRFPFTVKGSPDCFSPGTTFEDVWNLYVFDRELRHLVLEATKRVEISGRSRLAYELGHALGPLSYVDNKNFLRQEIHAGTLKRLKEELDRSKEVFVRHHKNTLGMDWPPIWVIVEVASYGSVSSLLTRIKEPHIRQAVASSYFLDETTFCSLFHHLSLVRNTAAHHSRLWNRKFAVKFKLPRKKPKNLWENFHHEPAGQKDQGEKQERHIYNTLVLLIHLMRCIDAGCDWPNRLHRHLLSLNAALFSHMGFPDDWAERPIWKSLR